MSVSLDELVKATQSLKTAKALLEDATQTQPKNLELYKALRDSCIQRFEFCVELAWKTSIKTLGLQTRAPNPAIREMAMNSLISDPKLWFQFLESRNKSSHTYDEEVAVAIYKDAVLIIPELDKLIANLRKIS